MKKLIHRIFHRKPAPVVVKPIPDPGSDHPMTCRCRQYHN